MINTLISQIDHENITVTRYNEEESTFTDIGTFAVSIQGIPSSVKVQGYVMNKSLEGYDINSLFMMYSPNVDIKASDTIKRIERDGLIYEVQASEPNGVGTILEHRESLILRVSNQDE